MMRQLVPYFVRQQAQQGVQNGCLPAATLFADISGYTALTETLMQYHKDGAEGLSEALSATFGALVKVVYDHAGMISLFAGDALTGIFPYEPAGGTAGARDAVERAVAAAFAIQSFFHAENGTRWVRTKYGDFPIACKIGLAAGIVNWGIVGTGASYTFYFRGDAMYACARAEQQAASSEIVADVALLSLVKAHVVAVPATDACFVRLTTCKLAPRLSQAREPAPEYAELARFVPAAVLDLAVEAEFREICPVFVIFEEPADPVSLHAFVDTVMQTAASYGGILSQIEFGDKGSLILLLFGAPIAYENNVERAAQCLLALRRAHRPVAWRAGLTHGTVWAGFRGGVERFEYGAIGDVMNLAARLAARAPWGEIWMNAAVHKLLGDGYQVEPVGALQFKGRRHPLQVVRLAGGAALATTKVGRGQLIGRTSELAEMEQFLAPIFAGEFAGVLVVCGEAGMGKSRLVDELRRRHSAPPDGVAQQVLWLSCPADEMIRQSLNPFKYCLRTYFQQSAEVSGVENRRRFTATLEALLDLLPTGDSEADAIRQGLERTQSILAAMVDLYVEDSLYDRLEPRLRYENILAVFKLFVKALARMQPVVLHVDDVQWLDQDSHDLLHLLTNNVEQLPFALICTTRYLDDGQVPALAFARDVVEQRITLRPLEIAGVLLCAEQVLHGRLEQSSAEFIAARTGGNPFFVEQLTEDLHERGMFAQIETDEGVAFKLLDQAADIVPTSISAVLVSRLDRLTPATKVVVQTAAVIGREFELPVLSAMLPAMTHLTDNVDDVVQRQIWQPASALRYIFQHILLRDAAYDMQLRARLRQLHRAAAEAIELLFVEDLTVRWADLAYHYRRAEIAERERHYARLAGQRAASQYANADAIAYLTRALDLTPAGEAATRYDIILLRESVYDHLGARQLQKEELVLLYDLAAMLADPQRQAEVLLRRANYADVVGEYAVALADADTAIESTEVTVNLALAAAAHRQRGRVLWHQGDYPRAGHELEHALQLAQETQQPPLEADSLLELGLVTWSQGMYMQARRYLEQALDIVETHDLRDRTGLVLNSMGQVAVAQHDMGRARRYFTAALQIAHETGNRRNEGHALNNLGAIFLHQGEFANARNHFQQFLRLQLETDNRLGQGIAYDNLGTNARNSGDYAAALRFYEQAATVYQAIRDRSGEGMLEVNLARLAFGRQAYREACDHSQSALEITRQIGDREGEADALTIQAHAQTVLGLRTAAAEAYAQAWTLRQELEQPDLSIEVKAGLAQIAFDEGELNLAMVHVAEIMSFLENDSLDALEDAVAVYLVCYRVLQAIGDARAEGILMACHQILLDRAARIDDADLRRSFLTNIPVHRILLTAMDGHLSQRIEEKYDVST